MWVLGRIAGGFDTLCVFVKELTHKIVSHSASHEEKGLGNDVSIIDDEYQKRQLDFSQFPHATFAEIFWFTGAVTALIVFLLYQSFPIVILIIASYIISVAMEGPIRFLMKTFSFKRTFSLFVCYLLIVLLFLVILMIIPFIVVQIGELFSLVVIYGTKIQSLILEIGRAEFIVSRNFLPGYVKDMLLGAMNDPQFTLQLQASLSHLVGRGEVLLTRISALALSLAISFAEILGNVSLTLVLSVFFSLEKDSVLRFLIRVIGGKGDKQQKIHDKLVTLYNKLQLWLKGQLFLMLYVGLFVAIGLSLLSLFGIDLEKKWLLALIAGVTEIVPYVGPLVGAVPAILVALISHGTGGAIAVMILFGLVQWTENNIVVPVVMNRVLGINPLVIFICMLLGAWILGFIGIVLAVPFAVIITVLLDKKFE